MSENDNLQKADGKNEVDSKETTPTQETTSQVETEIENEVEIETVSEIEEPTEVETEETTVSEKVETEKETEVETVAEETEKVEVEVDVEEKSEVETSKDDHHDEIEASNAEDAEDESNAERHELEDKDYHAMTMDELVTELNGLLKHHKIQTISKHVNEIKGEFNAKFSALIDEKKEEFVAEGGNEIDFYYTNDTKKLFNSLYKEYKQAISAYYNEREQNLKQNLENRLAIIEEIKGLLNVEENINTTYKHFKELQESWRNAGPIPRDKYNNAWNTYHHHVERFYDFLHLNNDLRDMDFKHNYEQKLKIIERAEELAQDENTNRSFRELQVLHKMWKEELGPVGKVHREEIWERFSNATKTIHDKRQAYYADMDKAHEKNLEQKEEIIAQIIAVNEDPTNSHSAWQKKIKTIEKLREDFFNAGKVPIKVNEATWAKFKDAVRSFNRGKNHFYKDLKKDQYDNLTKKKDLIKIAEDNKESEDFATVTPLMKKIQNEWKKIGHVPRRDSDKIWKQFKGACNHYFDRMHAERKAENQDLYDAFDKKAKLLDDLKALELTEDPNADIKTLQAKISEWKEIGHVPQNKRYIDGKFYKAIDDAFDKLKMDKSKLEMIKFESKLENLANPNDTRLLDNEQNFIRKKIGDIKSEIIQLENNLQFFSNVKSDNPLVKDVHKNIANHKNQLDIWKAKLTKVRGMYS
jgi:ribosomal protein L17